MTKLLALVLSLLVLSSAASAQRNVLPIIDMHMHAKAAADFGPPPRPLCIPIALYAPGPRCPEPILSPLTDEAMIEQTVAILERRNIIGVMSGYTLEKIRPFQKAAPGRIIPAYGLSLGREGTLSPDA